MTMRRFAVSLVGAFLSIAAAASDVLFPVPLHLTRQIHDSIGGSQATVDQYCYANRVVLVSGSITTITDYERDEVIDIDRAERTYSITRFDDVARALSAGGTRSQSSAPEKRNWNLRAVGADAFEGEIASDAITRRVRVSVDRRVLLSKEALDVLIGAAWPASRGDEHLAVVEAARSRAVAAQSAGPAARTYPLPLEQHVTYVIDGARAEYRDVVTRVGEELVPPDLVSIPPDAKLVESRLVTRMRAIEMLDALARDVQP